MGVNQKFKQKDKEMTNKVNRIVILAAVSVSTLVVTTALAQQKMPETTTQSVKGATAAVTEHLDGTVVHVEGNHLAVRMKNGDMREFAIPESRRFVIDGREVTVQELKPGTVLHATVTTTTTSITDRTTTVGTGKVWWVAGDTVILTLPNNENRTYKVTDDYKFTVDGNKNATVSDLRRGMTVAAQRITEVPRTEIASNTVVTGQAPPPPKAVVAQAPPPTPRREVPPPAPVQVARAAPAPTPAPEPVHEAPPEKLPTTASQLPLIGILGLFFTAIGLGSAYNSLRAKELDPGASRTSSSGAVRTEPCPQRSMPRAAAVVTRGLLRCVCRSPSSWFSTPQQGINQSSPDGHQPVGSTEGRISVLSCFCVFMIPRRGTRRKTNFDRGGGAAAPLNSMTSLAWVGGHSVLASTKPE